MSPEEKIRTMMGKEGVRIECIEHEPVYTNSAHAQALGVKESDTVKSLIVKTREGRFAVIVLPGDKKMDWKQIGQELNTKRLELAKAEEVSRLVGCEVGCIPPFGHVTELPIYMDKDFLKKDLVYFNPGAHDKTFKIRALDLKKLCNPKMI